MNETFVRFGNSGLCSISGPIRPTSSSSISSPTSIAHWGLPIETCWKRHSRPAALRVPAPSGPPEGKSGDVTEARPMSSVAVSGPVMVGRIAPALVRIEKSSASAQPRARR